MGVLFIEVVAPAPPAPPTFGGAPAVPMTVAPPPPPPALQEPVHRPSPPGNPCAGLTAGVLPAPNP